MNKYLQMLKSEKQPPRYGAKGAEGPSAPFAPTSGGRKLKICDALHNPMQDRHHQRPIVEKPPSPAGAAGEKDPSAPFAPAPGGRKSEILDVLTSQQRDLLEGLPIADGYFTPYMPPVSPETLREWQAELAPLVARCARYRGWGEDAVEMLVAALFIIALPHSLLMKRNNEGIARRMASEGMKKCPHCAEFIKIDAKVCRYCGRDVPVTA